MNQKQPQTAPSGASARFAPLAVNNFVRENVAKEMAAVYDRLQASSVQASGPKATPSSAKNGR